MPQKKELDIQKLAENFITDRTSDNFGKLYDRIKFGLKSYIFDVVKDANSVDEVEVLVLEKIWKNIHMYDPDKAKFSTWLYRIALFESLQYSMNKTKTRRNIVTNDISDLYNSTLYAGDKNFSCQDEYNIKTDNYIDFEFQSNDEIRHSLYDASVECINNLPDNFKLILNEKLLNGLTINQIAEKENIPVTTVKNWLFKGRLKLREMIKDRYAYLYESYIQNEAF